MSPVNIKRGAIVTVQMRAAEDSPTCNVGLMVEPIQGGGLQGSAYVYKANIDKFINPIEFKVGDKVKIKGRVNSGPGKVMVTIGNSAWINWDTGSRGIWDFENLIKVEEV